ncbi:UDP-N-acetylglucosamine 2-epimerase [Desulfobaculum xiamenense]|uniref:UDP-N-acetylglucosamine 2-epimerase n=1 Tax=Desulfobaculum xiamenense TaxID=995050 RepID=A0A846QWI7_9BACT|nr:UDP-N-acetyl glucosamine 2-epimerase [Desulfobaculum xiamenense]NJB68979.1 UDP-N-acetylglucosamine 2-epimerase [Desulfobaculum xiamenense]
MRIAIIVGARPQFVKAAVIERALRAAGMETFILHTGQHYDDRMSEVFFRELGLSAPARNLGVGSGSHGAQTGRMLEALEAALVEDRPDAVVVPGDTNSTLAGALAAVKLGIPVVHVEAGMRSFNRAMPEEHNRVLADHAADILCVSTAAAVENLRREGLANVAFGGRRVEAEDVDGTPLSCVGAPLVVNVGDVMYDAALHYGERAQAESNCLERLGVRPGEYVLATVHRAENTTKGKRLSFIFRGLATIAREIPIVLPLHPRTGDAINSAICGRWPIPLSGMTLIEPQSYLDMLQLVRNARAVCTDSGGLQKEAYFFGRPCVTLRDETEWVELVDGGFNVVSGADPDAIPEAYHRVRDLSFTPQPDFYGSGRAGEAMAAVIRNVLEKRA